MLALCILTNCEIFTDAAESNLMVDFSESTECKEYIHKLHMQNLIQDKTYVITYKLVKDNNVLCEQCTEYTAFKRDKKLSISLLLPIKYSKSLGKDITLYYNIKVRGQSEYVISDTLAD